MALVGGRRVFGFGSYLGDYGMTALGQAAKALIQSLPPGSGVSPIGRDPAYPWPHNPAQDNVVDTQYGGNRYVDWYTAHPVKDASGLLEWVSPHSYQVLGGLDQVHVLAANAITQGVPDGQYWDGNFDSLDLSWSADFHAPNAVQAAKPLSSDLAQPLTTAPQEYTPTTYHPIADHEVPPPDLLQHPDQPPVLPTPVVPTQPVIVPQSIPVNPPLTVPVPAQKVMLPDAPPSIAPISQAATDAGNAFSNVNQGSAMQLPTASSPAPQPQEGQSLSSLVSSPLAWGALALVALSLLGARNSRR